MSTLRQNMTPTKLEYLSVELFQEIFSYFQYHEIFETFSNLNSRFSAMIVNMPLLFISVGQRGMSLATGEFYHTHLLQSNVSHRLISLCVSDAIAIDNGLWLAQHLSAFINLRNLSLIDIKRSSFELMLNTTSVHTSLIAFRVCYGTCRRAAHTFVGVPEGAYYEQIWRLFPSLEKCFLGFSRFVRGRADQRIVLPLNSVFMPIRTSLLNIKSLALKDCSVDFLFHVIEHHPQLEELSFYWSEHWLLGLPPLRNDHYKGVRITKRMAPNLRRLKVADDRLGLNPLELVDELFERDVFYSLLKFTLLGLVARPDVLRNTLSMLSDQCVYSVDVWWKVRDAMPVSNINTILIETFHQIKARLPIEIDLMLFDDSYDVVVSTVPRVEKFDHFYNHTRATRTITRARSQSPSSVPILKNCWVNIQRTEMGRAYLELTNDPFSQLTLTGPLHEMTSLRMILPFDFDQLRSILPKMIQLRELDLMYSFECLSEEDSSTRRVLKLLSDTPLCNRLVTNGLQKFNFYVDYRCTKMTNIASLIVDRLPHLQSIELKSEVIGDLAEALSILINGLPKLNSIIFNGYYGFAKKLRSIAPDLREKTSRRYRLEYYDSMPDAAMLYVWL